MTPEQAIALSASEFWKGMSDREIAWKDMANVWVRVGERIKEINLIDDVNGFDGYEIVTDKQRITLIIDNEQCCCENWGYFWCNDSVDEYIGSEILEIKLTDTALTQSIFEHHFPNGVYGGGVMFVTIETSVGTLQFVAYNEHNGYYGHRAKIISEQLNYEEFI